LIAVRRQGQQSYWLAELGTLLDAGIPADRALASLHQSHQLAWLNSASQRLARGEKLSRVLMAEQAINGFDARVLEIAEQTGLLGRGCLFIAERQQARVIRVSALAAALWMPNAVLLLGLIAALFIKITADGMLFVQALLATIPIAAMTFIAGRILLWILLRDPRVWVSLVWRIQWLRQRSRRFAVVFETEFYSALNWLLNAGIPMESAITTMANLLDSSEYQQSVTKAASLLSQGESLTTALLRHGLAPSPEMRHVLASADLAGTHSSSLEKLISIKQQQRQQMIDDENAWIPRFYYTLVLLAAVTMMHA
jgi:type II secretory pathway component PulF